MESIQFDTTISSLSEISIPENLKEKMKLNEQVHVLVIPAGERLYDDWDDAEWNQLTLLNDSTE